MAREIIFYLILEMQEQINFVMGCSFFNDPYMIKKNIWIMWLALDVCWNQTLVDIKCK